MNYNTYWGVFKNIESELNNLMFSIHFDDKQLDVYSSKIIDLILRASSEIESLSKELYKTYSGVKKGNLKFDYDALKFLNEKWNINEKKVILSSYNCFISNKVIVPFNMNENKTGKVEKTYGWNNSYQNLKHDRANNLEFGSVKYLIDVTAALFILNVYYRNIVFDLKEDRNGSNFDVSLGSSVFSVMIHVHANPSLKMDYLKDENYNGCLYLLKPTDETKSKLANVINMIEKKANEKYFLDLNNNLNPPHNNSTIEIFDKNYKEEFNKHQILMINLFQSLKYEAVLNVNQF